MPVAISGLLVDEQSTGRDKFSGSSHGFDRKPWWSLGRRSHHVRTSDSADPCVGEKLNGGIAVSRGLPVASRPSGIRGR